LKNKFLVLFGCSLLLFGCGKDSSQSEVSEEEKKIAISEEGTIQKKEITHYEDATHFFETKSRKSFLLKSSLVDLSRYEEEEVLITGETLKKTPEGKTPVISVFSVEVIPNASSVRESVFTESEYYFSAPLPGNWQRKITEEETLQYFPEGNDPIITVSVFPTGDVEALRLQEEMVSGISVSIGEKVGWRLLEDGGKISIIVPLKKEKKIVLFHFTPRKDVGMEKMIFYNMLTELVWISSPDSKKEEEISPSDMKHCGGRAKKLCPNGFRCELKSFEENATGVCVDSTLSPGDISALLKTDSAESEEENTNSENGSKDESTPIFSVPDNWTEYKRERLSYSFALPRSWWWREEGVSKSQSEVISRVGIAEAEVTEDNIIVVLELLAVPAEKYTETSIDANGKLSISVPRDVNSSFRIVGAEKYSSEIRGIAHSLSSF
jgi:hypothetical protein